MDIHEYHTMWFSEASRGGDHRLTNNRHREGMVEQSRRGTTTSASWVCIARLARGRSCQRRRSHAAIGHRQAGRRSRDQFHRALGRKYAGGIRAYYTYTSRTHEV